MKIRFLTLVLAGVSVLVINGYGLDAAAMHVKSVYPMYLDNNDNQVNDYLEQTTHLTNRMDGTFNSERQFDGEEATAPQGHPFTDDNLDGVCDYGQDGSNTWHGPGFMDQNGNGVSDWWDVMHPIHARHEGMRYRDNDQNGINDYFEEPWHIGPDHDFTDVNEDGICDYAQNGGPNWHGPGFMDLNDNGMHDDWESNGRGHGGKRHMMEISDTQINSD